MTDPRQRPPATLSTRNVPCQPCPTPELHCHTSFSFLDGASAPDELVERAVELGLAALAVTDHGGLYGGGPVRHGSPGGWPPPGGGRGAGAGRCARSRSGPGGDSRPPTGAGRRPRVRSRWPVPGPGRTAGLRRRAPGSRAGIQARGRGYPGASPTGTRPPPWPPRDDQGGPPRGGGAAARSASRPAGPGRRRLSEPVPAPLPRQPGGHETRPARRPRRCSPSTPKGWRRCRAAARARSPAGSAWGIGMERGPRPSGWPGSTAGAIGQRPAASSWSCPSSPPRRRLAGGRDRGPGRGPWAAGGRHQRCPLRAP